MNRYGINFYNQNLDINASVYFEAEDFFSAKNKALTFQKEGWVAGNTFFIEEKNLHFYVPVEDFLAKDSFKSYFAVIRITENKVTNKEAFEQATQRIVESANAYLQEKAYMYKEIFYIEESNANATD